MGRIDDPFDQIDTQHRDAEDGGALAPTLSVAAPIVALFSPAAAALAALTAFAANYTNENRRLSRIQAFQEGFRQRFGEHEDRLQVVEQRTTGPDAEEAAVEAFRYALQSARLDKARMFGQILGGTLAEDKPNWQEAADFIRNLEELGSSDREALKILWNVQRSAFRTITTGGRREMSTDANDYVETWKDVLKGAEKGAVTKDDWYARCARLNGFGLAILVQFQGSDAMCFRLTGRAVRLLGLLGRNIDRSAYPKVLYHATAKPVTVNDEDAHQALGEGWAESPEVFKK